MDAAGTVVTTSAVVENCSRIDNDHDARVLDQDRTLGMAVLRPVTAMAPISVAGLAPADPLLQSDVAVAGYSFEGRLGSPTLTLGKFFDSKGIRGETELSRLALAALPGDEGGRVVGMLLPDPASAQRLPRNVSLAANAHAIQNVLIDAGLRTERGEDAAKSLDPEDLGRLASGMTALMSCWD